MKKEIVFRFIPLIMIELLLILMNSCKKEEATTGTVEDFEGNIYKTVKIGNQWLMAENLKSTINNKGVSITEITGNSSWSTDISGAFCWYDNDLTNKDKYGALYNYYAVNSDLCPLGWHVPSNDDLITLRNYLGDEYEAGGPLKEIGTVYWGTPNAKATNITGFSARGSGFRNTNGIFQDIRVTGSYWTTSVMSTGVAGAWHLDYNSGWLGGSQAYYNEGLSVRCIKY
jgi:uncharacterized protein (TIGR02145 family)